MKIIPVNPAAKPKPTPLLLVWKTKNIVELVDEIAEGSCLPVRAATRGDEVEAPKRNKHLEIINDLRK